MTREEAIEKIRELESEFDFIIPTIVQKDDFEHFTGTVVTSQDWNETRNECRRNEYVSIEDFNLVHTVFLNL